MPETLATRVAERLRESLGSPLFQPIGSQAIAALARLVEASPHHFNEASADRWLSALRDVAEALGINDVSAPGAPPADTKENT